MNNDGTWVWLGRLYARLVGRRWETHPGGTAAEAEKVRVRKGSAQATVVIVLDKQDLAVLEDLVRGCGGAGAGATDPKSPLRAAAFKVCRELFPRGSFQLPDGPEPDYWQGIAPR